jgi:hypothetical protein
MRHIRAPITQSSPGHGQLDIRPLVAGGTFKNGPAGTYDRAVEVAINGKLEV